MALVIATPLHVYAMNFPPPLVLYLILTFRLGQSFPRIKDVLIVFLFRRPLK
jgi:hypothetical protein